ncbi:hypothetical protein, variant 1 [Aphanomyces astaci]|uniref:histone acetyltransferase n=1 Tax=Aphanomyces astaci TaxID=112090 RepID=W4G668_APHAT|nr:hypothetical protein, variant 1 [Aphanomyces astaci]ETV74781.1 hypothetical protein, variant 1 [Aphanomyces astaci]|eukprot:XP_009835868.1 hypothetical protein, variant 1 [Aphanomyces astaci]
MASTDDGDDVRHDVKENKGGEDDSGIVGASPDNDNDIDNAPDLPIAIATEVSEEASPRDDKKTSNDVHVDAVNTTATTSDVPIDGDADVVGHPAESPIPLPGAVVEEESTSEPTIESSLAQPPPLRSPNVPSEDGANNHPTSSISTMTPVVPSSSPLKRKRTTDDSIIARPCPIPADYSASINPSGDPDLTSAILSRDEMAKKEEDTGLLEFCVITNDGTPERMVQLMTLKNIFSKQLPKMPKEYIVRLVFDRNHQSMVILKNKKTVVGGICYRPFLANHFGEIAFCAITASEQVKGYGTRLMNHLKEFVKTQHLTHFLTYADNYAIGYFKKQGFSKVVSMARPNWFGYIKDYDGGTLMECQIHPHINYLNITAMVHAQRAMLVDEIQKRSKAAIVYPGLTTFCDARLVNIHAVPGVKEAGWSQTLIRTSRTNRDSSSLKQQLQSMWKSFSNHRSAWPFHEPVDVTVVTDYLEIIQCPIDLSAIQKKIDENAYATKAAFKDDLVLMCENSIAYNSPDTNYYKAAKDLLEFVKKKVVLEPQDGRDKAGYSSAPATKKHLVR